MGVYVIVDDDAEGIGKRGDRLVEEDAMLHLIRTCLFGVPHVAHNNKSNTLLCRRK